jgi:uncharacterized protein (DUF1800 family)
MRTTRIATVVLAAAATLAAGTVTRARVEPLLASRVPDPEARIPDTDARRIVHVLNRIGFGPAPGDVEKVHRIGIATYIEQQLRPERIPDAAMTARLAGLATLTMTARELAEAYYIPARMERRRAQQQAARERSMDPVDKRAMRSPEQIEAMQGERRGMSELAEQKILRAAYSERQLDEVMVDFWFNHFNVFAGKGLTRLYLSDYERDAIRPHVFGSFRDLLGATAQSPAMLFYLDNWQSSASEGSAIAPPVASRFSRTRPDTPPARPRMRPEVPGRSGRTPAIGRRRAAAADAKPAPNRRPRGLNENYARELMELHTIGVDGGYTQKDVQEIARAFTGWTIADPRRGGGFHFEPRMHDDGEKIVLDHRIEAGGGRKDAEQVLDILASHPSTARFIASKLARRFVADDPPAALVDRAAARFRDTNGNIREVVRTIVTSPEFSAPAAYRAKVKTPFEFVAGAVRATSAEIVDARMLVQAMRTLGMPLYGCQPPTGYEDRAAAWVNTGALLNRMNFAVSLTGGRMRGVRTSAAGDRDSARDAFVVQVFADDLSQATRSTVAKTTQTSQAIALLVGSPEFQRR